MKNVAIILVGGVDSRLELNKLKTFLNETQKHSWCFISSGEF